MEVGVKFVSVSVSISRDFAEMARGKGFGGIVGRTGSTAAWAHLPLARSASEPQR